jgi:proline iminopeptidase
MGSPLPTAWELARACPDARLVVIDDSGTREARPCRSEIFNALESLVAGS